MKVLLLDADGVVLKKDEYFSERYAHEHNVPPEKIIPFFKGPLADCQRGTKDLRDELQPYLEQWGWQGSVDDFMTYWFEDVQLNPGIEARIQQCKEKGIACYMASNNEHYRARQIETLLGDTLDGYFFSADLKVRKSDPNFFNHILEQLNTPAAEVSFIDNDEENIEAAKEVGINAMLYNEKIWQELLSDGSMNEFKNQ